MARTYRRIGRRPKLWLSEFVIQSDHGSKVFSLYVSRRGQAQWLRGAFRVANSLPSVAGLGWLALLDEPESNLSTTFGLLTAKGVRKPSFYAYRDAPSRRLRPAVRVARRSGRRVRVSVKPAVPGRVTLRLVRRNGRTAVRRSVRARRAPRRRDHPPRRARGRYTLLVDAHRGERVRRRVTVR